MNDVFEGVQSQNSLCSIFRLYLGKIATCLDYLEGGVVWLSAAPQGKCQG